MPLSGLPCDGTYKIVPVVRSDAPTSINSAHLPTGLPVQLGLADVLWAVTEKSGGVYQLSHKSAFRYTGKDGQAVTAFINAEHNLLWNLGPATSGNYYGLTIAPKDASEKGWTVADESDPNSKIVLEKITYLPPDIYPPIIGKATQLFRFEKVDE